MKRYNRTSLKRHDRTEKFKPRKSLSLVRLRSRQGRTGSRFNRSTPVGGPQSSAGSTPELRDHPAYQVGPLPMTPELRRVLDRPAMPRPLGDPWPWLFIRHHGFVPADPNPMPVIHPFRKATR